MLTNPRRAARGSVMIRVAAALALLALVAGAFWYMQQRGAEGGLTTGEAGTGQPYLPGKSEVFFRDGGRLGLADESGLVPHEGSNGSNRHVVHVSRNAAEQAAAKQGPLAIELPNGERFNVQFERTELAPNGDWTFIGKVATRLGPQSAVLTFGPAGVFGVLPLPEGSQMQLTTTRMVTVLEPIRPMHPRNPQTGSLPVDYVLPTQETAQSQADQPQTAQPQTIQSPVAQSPVYAVAPVGAAPMSLPTRAAAPITVAAQAEEVQIDVLGLYTTNMVGLRGSVAAAETEANNYLAVANQAHRDSKTGVKLNFVGLKQVDYPASNLNNVALNDLGANRIPGVDVAALRDALRADLVAMLRPYVSGDANGGIANLAGGGLQGAEGAYEGAAYSVSNLSAYTFAHETGHNLGSMHDYYTSIESGGLGASGYGAFSYSFGYRQDGPPAFATIMAYSSGQPTIGYFSHPGTVACLGVACGTPEADNARSIRNMAGAISEYRLPPNLIYVLPNSVVEGDPGSLWERNVYVTVKLSTPAPAGGVRFDIRTKDGTAVAGADYRTFSQAGVVIPQGESERQFPITILPDELVEGDETFAVMLSNVSGADIYRSEAAVRILDDDPRVMLTGRIVAPSGYSLPDSRIQVEVCEQGVHGFQCASYWAQPPSFDLRLPVEAGSSVKITIYADAPYAQTSYDLGVVNGSQYRDIVLKRAIKLTGALRFPSGQSAPSSPINIVAWGLRGDSWGIGYSANPPDFTYTFNAVEGAEVRLDARDPPDPLVRQHIALGELWADRVQDITMGTVPSLVMTGARIPEGEAGQERTIDLSLYLSTPAPSGGVQVDVEVVSGTATAGSDFVAKAKQRITLSQGNNSLTFPVVIKGDSVPEPTEWFKVVMSNPSGAWLPSPEAVVYIENDDFGVLRNDFEGNGRSGVFWRNLADGRNIIWRGGNYATQVNPGSVLGKAWSVVGAGDFNGDGKSDLFWRNAGTGQNIIWPSGDGSRKYSVETVAGLDWKVVATGDFNGDGRADVFWRNGRNGQNIIWWSGNPATRIAEQAVALAWTIVGAGDLNGDGKDEVFWRNTTTGANIVWWSGRYAGFTQLMGVTNQAWEVVAVGDLNGDRKADLFWRNRSTGENIIWWGGSYANQVREPVVATAWKVVAAGDYNGDGKIDLFWRNGTTGANIIWDSGRYAGRRNVTGVTNTAWVVQ